MPSLQLHVYCFCLRHTDLEMYPLDSGYPSFWTGGRPEALSTTLEQVMALFNLSQIQTWTTKLGSLSQYQVPYSVHLLAVRRPRTPPVPLSTQAGMNISCCTKKHLLRTLRRQCIGNHTCGRFPSSMGCLRDRLLYEAKITFLGLGFPWAVHGCHEWLLRSCGLTRLHHLSCPDSTHHAN